MTTLGDFCAESDWLLEAWAQEAERDIVRETRRPTHPRRSDSRQNTDYSRTHNAEILILGSLMRTLDALERSVSLDESLTSLEDYISTASLCSRKNIPLGTAGPLTSEIATQILSQAMAHRVLATIMQSKTETWSQEDSNGQAETTPAYLDLVGSGLASSWRRLVTSFLDYARIWTLDRCVSILPLCERTQIGGIDWTGLHTPIQQVLSLKQTTCLVCLDGHMQILATAKEVSFQMFGKAERRGVPPQRALSGKKETTPSRVEGRRVESYE